MKDLPAREKLDLVEKVAQYLVLAGTLDKTSPIEDYDRANELSLELAMVLPGALYRQMVEAGSHSGSGRSNPASVALAIRKEMLGLEDDLTVNQIAFHTPGVPERPKGKAH